MPRRSGWWVATLAWGVGLAGVGFRLRDFGRWGFWNDEAWVALSTRVEGLGQWWLSLSTTPVLWAAALRPLALLPVRPEVSLRLLPLACACLALWVAWAAGKEIAGHVAGGLLAVAVLAVEPASAEYAQLLKQYSAEALFTLLAVHQTARVVRGGTLTGLVAVLVLGMGFTNSQLLVAPPLLGALVLRAVARRDWRELRRVLVASVAVGLAGLLAYRFLVAPRFSPVMDVYWARRAVRPAGVVQALGLGWSGVRAQLERAWGGAGAQIAGASLVVAGLLPGPQRTIALGLLGLVIELVVVSLRQPVAWGEARLLLFLAVALNVAAAGAVAIVARAVWRQRWLWPAVPLGAMLLAHGVATERSWTLLGHVQGPEDLGPLVRLVEESRRPGDGILLYARSRFVYAYYQTPTPILFPLPTTTVGFAPVVNDPAVVVVYGRDVPGAVERAFAGRERVWFLGSRFLGGDEQRILAALAARGRRTLETRSARAVVALVER